jgi:GT2 family glycosyltransferase
LSFRVALIVVNWNSGPLLERCLAAVAAQTLPPREIVVVDNDSHDGSADGLEARFPGVRVLRPGRNLGFAAANNLAAAEVRESDWLALLNPDAFPEPRWLERLAGAATTHPSYSFFTSRLVSAGDPERLDGTGDLYSTSGLAWRRDHGRPVAQAPDTASEVFSACAAAALYRREAFLDVGSFDESYFCFFEDVDLAFRLRLAGHRCLYVPDAVVHHVGSAMTRRGSDFAVYHGHRNLVWTYVKDMPWPLVLTCLPQHLLLNLASLAWFTLRGQPRAIFRAKWDALRSLPRVWTARRAIQGRAGISSQELRRAFTSGVWTAYLGRSWTS